MISIGSGGLVRRHSSAVQNRGSNRSFKPVPALKPLFAHSALVRRLRFVAVSFVLGALSGPVLAWSNHALCTWPALAALPRIADAAPVPVERLEDFLTAEGPALAQLLDTEERWARDHVPTYPARPDALAFRYDTAAPAEARRRFLAALRINPAVPLSLYVQVRPGEAPGPRRVLAEAEVTTLKRSETTRESTLVASAVDIRPCSGRRRRSATTRASSRRRPTGGGCGG